MYTEPLWKQDIEIGRLTKNYSILQCKILQPTPDFPSTSALVKLVQGKNFIFLKLSVSELDDLITTFSLMRSNFQIAKESNKQIEEQLQSSRQNGQYQGTSLPGELLQSGTNDEQYVNKLFESFLSYLQKQGQMQPTVDILQEK